MRNMMRAVHVTVRPDGFTPRAFRWEGNLARVLSVEAVVTRDVERRYRVQTSLGCYELSWFVPGKVWYVRRGPSRFARMLAQRRHPARYGVPAWRRRARWRIATAWG